MHAYGPIYVLSAEVVASLAAARNNRSFIYIKLFSTVSICFISGVWPTKYLLCSTGMHKSDLLIAERVGVLIYTSQIMLFLRNCWFFV